MSSSVFVSIVILSAPKSNRYIIVAQCKIPEWCRINPQGSFGIPITDKPIGLTLKKSTSKLDLYHYASGMESSNQKIKHVLVDCAAR